MLALAGCASIPDSGAVHQGEDISAANSGFSVNYIPSGPAAGATQEQILSGFIGASSSPKNNYQIAREFLAPSFTSLWKPDQSLIVDTGSGRVYTRMAQKAWQLAVNPVADIDATGGYTEVDASSPVTLQFSFVKTSNGWRISKAPNGTVLDLPTFGDVFSPHALYFFSPDLGYLVPDLRWFASGQSTPTSIVKALLAGPSTWLGGGAVSSAFPEGTQLSADSVPVDNGRAEVDLNGEANQANPAALRLMKLQLERSLAGVTGITTVSISVEGNAVTVPDLAAASTPQSNPLVDSRPLVYTGHDFGFLTGKSVSDLPVSAEVAALKPRAVTVSADHKSAAVLAASGVYAVSKAGAKLVDARTGLIAPSLDPYGFIWSVPSSQPGKVLAVRPGGTQYAVATSWPEAASIASLAVSRDGTRLIALLRTGSQTSFVAAAIIRGDHDVPTKLG
ncbi:MAG: GerMN domain-containing protein, partial [Mycobacterium sp.]